MAKKVSKKRMYGEGPSDYAALFNSGRELVCDVVNVEVNKEVNGDCHFKHNLKDRSVIYDSLLNVLPSKDQPSSAVFLLLILFLMRGELEG